MVEEYLLPMAWSLVYLLEAFALLWIAKAAYTRLYRRVDLKAELFGHNNHALGVATSGYLLGVVIALGGVLAGSAGDWKAEVSGIALYGLGAVVLMLLASFLCEKVLLSHFDNTREVVEAHNAGIAFVEAGVHIANGLILLAINQGSGSWWVGLVFWVLAQGLLLLVGRLYDAATPHEIHLELQRDNAAVGLAFGGALVGMGNIISIAVAGDFVGWEASLAAFGAWALFGLVVLFGLKKLTDALLAPGVALAAEQTGEKPNLGAGLLEAFGYIGGSMLLVWVF